MKFGVAGLLLMNAILLMPCGLAKELSARGMFIQQAQKPQAQLNTGLAYWLELERSGKKSRVSNKQSFQSGDRLRIHVKPNVDGFAYIMMVSDSKGEKHVLFPSEGFTENGIKANKELVLPIANGKEDAWLSFDEHPGTEVLRVMISRKQLDPKQELEGEKPSGPSVVVASSTTQTDQIPQGTLVSITVTPAGKIPVATRGLTIESGKPHEQGETTVVTTDPSKPLSVDIALDHKKG